MLLVRAMSDNISGLFNGPSFIEVFWREIAKKTSTYVDFRDACAREVAILNEDPTSRIQEASFYTSLGKGGVPSKLVDDLQRAWGPKFNKFRRLSRVSPQRTPPLKLFKICATSVALKFNRPLEKALSESWRRLATRPAEREALDGLLSTMERYRIDPQWTARLAETWEFLFGRGGHSDAAQKAPDLYQEIHDEPASHVSIIHPIEERRGAGEAEGDDLDSAMELLNRNPVLIISGRGKDAVEAWMEEFGNRLSHHDVDIVHMDGSADEIEDLSDYLKDRLFISLIMTEKALAAADEGLKRYIGGGYLETNAEGEGLFTDPLRTLVILADRGRRTHERAAEEIAPVLRGMSIRGEVPVLAIENRSRKYRALRMPNGIWDDHIDRFKLLAASNFFTIGRGVASTTSFRTFNLKLG